MIWFEKQVYNLFFYVKEFLFAPEVNNFFVYQIIYVCEVIFVCYRL